MGLNHAMPPPLTRADINPCDTIRWRCWHGDYATAFVEAVYKYRIVLRDPDGHRWSMETLPADVEVVR